MQRKATILHIRKCEGHVGRLEDPPGIFPERTQASPKRPKSPQIRIGSLEFPRTNIEGLDTLIHLLGVSRHLERIGDLARNIAEDVIYMVEGEIVRHRAEDYVSGGATATGPTNRLWPIGGFPTV